MNSKAGAGLSIQDLADHAQNSAKRQKPSGGAGGRAAGGWPAALGTHTHLGLCRSVGALRSIASDWPSYPLMQEDQFSPPVTTHTCQRKNGKE